MLETLDTAVESFLAVFGRNPYVRAVVLVAASLVGAKIADWIITRIILIWTRKTHTDLDDRLIALLHQPVIVSFVLIGVWLAVRQLGVPAGAMVATTRLLKTVALLMWLAFLLKASSLIFEIMSRWEKRVTFIQPRTVVLLDNVARLVLVGGAAYAFFLTWGIDVGGLLLSAGVIGIALGLAAKDTLANLFSGISIIADAPYEVGDFVILDGGERGQIVQIGLRSTRMITRDDIEVTVPNAIIANGKIINETGGRWDKERVRVKVGVAYGSDIDRVRDLLIEVAHANPHIDAEPEPRVRFRAFGDSGLQLELMGWIGEPILRGRVLDALNTAVYKRFNEEGIEIPFPKRDVYVRSSD